MKKYAVIFLVLILCMICAAAGAAPAVTDGTTTGWIADNNYLFLQKADGRNLQMPMEMADLLIEWLKTVSSDNNTLCRDSFSRRLFCLMKMK